MKFTPAVLAMVAQAVSGLDFFESGNSFGVPGKNASYDYVIVGGGTGGLAIAARLAEDKNASVAVIEAGGFYQIDNGNGRSVKISITHALTYMLTCLQRGPWSLRQSRRSSCPREFSTADRLGVCHYTSAWIRKSQHSLCSWKNPWWLQCAQLHALA